jgi:hypothetical protein
MAQNTRVILIPDDSELARALRDAAAAPVHVTAGGVLYRISREGVATAATTAPPDEEAVLQTRAGIRKATGAWKAAGVDAEAFKQYLAERRRTANRPSIRL